MCMWCVCVCVQTESVRAAGAARGAGPRRDSLDPDGHKSLVPSSDMNNNSRRRRGGGAAAAGRSVAGVGLQHCQLLARMGPPHTIGCIDSWVAAYTVDVVHG
ncbi:hypothetical protein PLESTB_001059800 [Pleodorina starrii]|uniref:Uncharacterized protein n=1 Tax=Pleodorina starrii TaxID=330485 RepID=A0A9W6F554_9CHLO|nr:hypothetical protein PLESTB_001059800 [Pleodorina starrii]